MSIALQILSASTEHTQIDDTETQGTLHTGPTGVVHRGAGPIPRSTRTPEQARVIALFMAAAGRVKVVHEAMHALVAYYAGFAFPLRIVDTLGVERKGLRTPDGINANSHRASRVSGRIRSAVTSSESHRPATSITY